MLREVRVFLLVVSLAWGSPIDHEFEPPSQLDGE